MSAITLADRVWNRACAPDTPRSHTGDRALANLLLAHGLAMNGGILHAVECLSSEQLANAKAGYTYFGLCSIASLLQRAQSLLSFDSSEADLGPAEFQYDNEYARILPSDEALSDRIERHFASHPDEYAPVP